MDIISENSLGGGTWNSPDGELGIGRFTDALREHPDASIQPYYRSSGSCKGGSLGRKAAGVVADVACIALGRTIIDPVYGVEKGTPSIHRGFLMRAIDSALRNRAILVTSDLSRFLRSEKYNRWTNREVFPTKGEFDWFDSITRGVVAKATLVDPLSTERERNAQAIRRSNCGRPRGMDDEMTAQVFADLGCLYLDRGGRWRWETPIDKVARRHGVSIGAILRAMNRLAPNGLSWRDNAMGKMGRW